MLYSLFVIRTRTRATCLNLPGHGRATEHILIVYARLDRNMNANIFNE